MVDMTPPLPDDGLGPSPEPLVPERQGLLADPQTRIIAIVAAVVALLIVVGVAGGLVFLSMSKKATEQATVDAVNASLNTPKPAATATASIETTVEGNRVAVPVTNKDVFTSRDPFVPVLEALPAVVASSAPATPSANVRNILVLEDIADVGGVLKANITWNGELFSGLEAGKQVGNSPWQILSLTKTTATMLFGDVQVTLTIGEGIAKN